MISSRGTAFVDSHGRTLLLRGVNLGGSSKVPRVPDGATHLPDSLRDHRAVSFVDRPFPLAEADEHLGRLHSWGLTFLRLLVTWEAVEHAGPGEYDERYLDYLRAVAERAAAHGIALYVDPHQDTWNRFTGGDGAPGWTLEAAGFELEALDATGAALTHQRHGDPLPLMAWPTNGGKLAAATMFTLFFGGNDFAPRTTVHDEPVQEFLQRHYVAFMARVAERLAGLPNVVGYGTMNEPLPGYIGWGDLTGRGGLVTLGDGPTPLQGMLLGEGLAQEIGVWAIRAAGIRRVSRRLLDPGGRRAWRDGAPCVWRANGVWDIGGDGTPVLLRPDHFARVRGRAVSFTDDYLRPFAERVAAGLRAVDPRALLFVEAPMDGEPPAWDLAANPRAAWAPHWYDDLAMVTKRYFARAALATGTHRLVLGARAVRRAFRDQLLGLAADGRARMGDVPVLVGELGIPYDMHGRRAFRTGDFRRQARALDRVFRAMEDALLGGTLWNYTPDNTNARGDLWNGEDMSIFSRDQQLDPADPDSGGRARDAFVRPYPRATAGTPLSLSFDMRRKLLVYEFEDDPAVTAPTEIFVPRRQYPAGIRVELSDGGFEHRPAEQLLTYRPARPRARHRITVRPA